MESGYELFFKVLVNDYFSHKKSKTFTKVGHHLKFCEIFGKVGRPTKSATSAANFRNRQSRPADFAEWLLYLTIQLESYLLPNLGV